MEGGYHLNLIDASTTDDTGTVGFRGAVAHSNMIVSEYALYENNVLDSTLKAYVKPNVKPVAV